MLDRDVSPRLTEDAFDAAFAAACLVELPDDWEGFFEAAGAADAPCHDQRQFRRMLLRSRALATYSGTQHVALTCDASASGVSFLNHEQLFPGDRVQITLARLQPVDLIVARCRKRGRRCYVCGARAADFTDRQALATLVKRLLAGGVGA